LQTMEIIFTEFKSNKHFKVFKEIEKLYTYNGNELMKK